MSFTEPVPTPSFNRRILQLQRFTIAWMVVEAAVSLLAAWSASSPALLGFGGDSAIELLSATVVFWRFRSNSNPELAERYAARIGGVLLIVLAVFVASASFISFLGYRQPQPSRLGIAVLLLAAVIMPWLRRRIGALRLSGLDRIGGRIAQRRLGKALGRSACRPFAHPSHPSRRLGSPACFGIVMLWFAIS